MKSIKKFEKYANKIVKKFAKKQELEFNGWISNEVGTLALFAGSEMSFTMEDILLDLKNNCEKHLILKWQDESVEASFKEEKKFINYRSYIMGLRYDKV